MLNITKQACLTCFKELSRIRDYPGNICIQVATVMKLKPLPKYDHVQYPSRRKLKPLDKRPTLPNFIGTPPLQTKNPHLIKGPEEFHNRIIYGEYGIQALEGGRIKVGHIEGMRLIVIRNLKEKNMFSYWRIPAPWLAVSSKGLGKKMGQGKGPIDRFDVPIKAGRMIMEIGGECDFKECSFFLERICKILPVKAQVVSRESMEKQAEYKKQRELANENPFNFTYCAKNNFLGIDVHLSPYDYLWGGKYNK